MKSKWIEFKGKKIFYQDFSNNFFNDEIVIHELAEVQSVIFHEPKDSVLVLTNFANTEITMKLMPILNEASSKTQAHISKTAVIGVSGVKRSLGDLLSKITGQSLMYFNSEIEAKDWLTRT